MAITLRTLKIKNNQLDNLESPVKMKVTPKFEAIFDVDGTTEVPEVIGKKLLGPGYPGLYSLVTEGKPIEKPVVVEKQVEKPIAPAAGTILGKRSKAEVKVEVPKPEQDEQEQFVKQII